MGKTYFIADTHFGEDNIRRYENRPFRSAEDMDSALIRNWNAVVTKDDEVYVLGDFGADQRETAVLSKLNGTKYLVKGNHDVYANDYYRKAGFAEVYDMPVLYKGFWILSHDAIYVNSNMPYANLFGHVHNSPIVKDYSSQHFCVSVERIGYTPINFDEIAEKVKDASNG
ncbi:MAG: metallophosphoesterase [Eubacteriales bacterium]